MLVSTGVRERDDALPRGGSWMTRFSRMTVSAYSVSPWKSGLGKAISEKPRLPTNGALSQLRDGQTDQVDRVNIEFTNR